MDHSICHISLGRTFRYIPQTNQEACENPISVTDKQNSILHNPSPQIPHIRPGREMPVFLLGSPELYKIIYIPTYNSIYNKGLRSLLRLHDWTQMVGAVSTIDRAPDIAIWFRCWWASSSSKPARQARGPSKSKHNRGRETHMRLPQQKHSWVAI